MVPVLYLFRVLEVSRSDVVVVDPTPDLLYTKRKSESSSKHTADCEQSKNGETAHAESINQPTSGWHKVIPPGISFNDIYINDYVLNSGKRAFKMDSDLRKKTCIRPETKGYHVFTEKYLHDIWCVVDNEHIYFKSMCFHSQRKYDQPHKIWCAIKMTNFNVDIGQCTCVAGKSSGYCNHLMVLLYQISHFSKSATTIISDYLSRRSMPMTWHKPRIEQNPSWR